MFGFLGLCLLITSSFMFEYMYLYFFLKTYYRIKDVSHNQELKEDNINLWSMNRTTFSPQMYNLSVWTRKQCPALGT